MTPEAQRIAIARLDGFSGLFSNQWLYEVGMEGENEWAYCATKDGERQRVPDYGQDANALREALLALLLTPIQQHDYHSHMLTILNNANRDKEGYCGPTHFDYVTATPAQSLEALVRALGKWTD